MSRNDSANPHSHPMPHRPSGVCLSSRVHQSMGIAPFEAAGNTNVEFPICSPPPPPSNPALDPVQQVHDCAVVVFVLTDQMGWFLHPSLRG